MRVRCVDGPAALGGWEVGVFVAGEDDEAEVAGVSRIMDVWDCCTGCKEGDVGGGVYVGVDVDYGGRGWLGHGCCLDWVGNDGLILLCVQWSEK